MERLFRDCPFEFISVSKGSVPFIEMEENHCNGRWTVKATNMSPTADGR